MDRGNCSSFDIENPCYSLAKSMKTELESLSRLSSECSIYRVPERLRRAKEKDYTPQVVSIGPLHHGRESLKAMEEHKMRYLKDFIERSQESLEFYIKVVEEEEARKERKLQTLTMPCMTELQQAGVRFEVGSSSNVFDIEFVKGILKIPKLIICGETELSIRNMVAFEQCHCDKNYINDYVVIMDRLVNTHKDVDLLVEYGIVENRLGDSNEAAILINKLADGVVVEFEEFYFAGLSEDLNTYYRRPWHRWKANLKQNYFNTPWAIISVIAGFILIILTLIQSVCSVISVVFDKQK